MAGSTNNNGVMAADTAAAGMAECTTAARAGSTGTPDATAGDPACTRHPRRRGTLYIHARCDPSSAHHTKTRRTSHWFPLSTSLKVLDKPLQHEHLIYTSRYHKTFTKLLSHSTRSSPNFKIFLECLIRQ
ncbi:hypothetical protein PIB30_083511 [Stylosanthes scabra]|uniref:Uncharacterized protein n=1 Tax=Stylosanthes scabra TaxID=79078 RepID=A0ABU6VQS9_9FABA|nr:hypothetical protein [Stylosanthes scabra]